MATGRRELSEAELEETIFRSLIGLKAAERKYGRPASNAELEEHVRNRFAHDKLRPSRDDMMVVISSVNLLLDEDFVMEVVDWMEHHPNEPLPWDQYRPLMLEALAREANGFMKSRRAPANKTRVMTDPSRPNITAQRFLELEIIASLRDSSQESTSGSGRASATESQSAERRRAIWAEEARATTSYAEDLRARPENKQLAAERRRAAEGRRIHTEQREERLARERFKSTTGSGSNLPADLKAAENREADDMPDVDDLELYSVVDRELKEGTRNDALWLKARVDAGGEEPETELAYVRLRIEMLKQEEARRRRH